MPARSYPRATSGGPICILTHAYNPWRPLACRAVRAISTPGLFNADRAARHAERHEALFIDPYGQDLRVVGRARWGQRPA